MSEEKRKDYKPIASPILQTLIAKELKFILLTRSKFRYAAHVSPAFASRCASPKTTHQSTPPGLRAGRPTAAHDRHRPGPSQPAAGHVGSPGGLLRRSGRKSRDLCAPSA